MAPMNIDDLKAELNDEQIAAMNAALERVEGKLGDANADDR